MSLTSSTPKAASIGGDNTVVRINLLSSTDGSYTLHYWSLDGRMCHPLKKLTITPPLKPSDLDDAGAWAQAAITGVLLRVFGDQLPLDL